MDAQRQKQRHKNNRKKLVERWREESVVADAFGINYIPSNLSVTPSRKFVGGGGVEEARGKQRVMVYTHSSRSSLLQWHKQHLLILNAQTHPISLKCELQTSEELLPQSSPRPHIKRLASLRPAVCPASERPRRMDSGGASFVKGSTIINKPMPSTANKVHRLPVLVLLILSFVQISSASRSEPPAPVSSCCPITPPVISSGASDHCGAVGGCNLGDSSSPATGLEVAARDGEEEEGKAKTTDASSPNKREPPANSDGDGSGENNNMLAGNLHHDDDDNQSANQSKSFTAQRVTRWPRVDGSRSDNITDNGAAREPGGRQGERAYAADISNKCRRSEAPSAGTSEPVSVRRDSVPSDMGTVNRPDSQRLPGSHPPLPAHVQAPSSKPLASSSGEKHRKRRRRATYGADLNSMGASSAIDAPPDNVFAGGKTLDSDHDREDDINDGAAVASNAYVPSAWKSPRTQVAPGAAETAPAPANQLIVSREAEKLRQQPGDLIESSQAADGPDDDQAADADDNDDLFLVPGSRLSMSAQEEEDYRQRRSSQGRGKVQTIYFGGFFPWLTDEDHHRATEASNQEHPSAGSKWRQQKPAARKQRPQRKQQQEQQYDTTGASSSSGTGGQPEVSPQLGRFILPAVRLALDHINNNSSILSSYRLEIVPRDTQCNATISLKEFFDMVYEAPKKMLLYGDACRVSTDPIAKASYFFDLIQISYADTDPIYTIENYPNFFRVVPSENALSLARIPFIRHFNWTRVGTIYQNLPRYSLPHSKLLTDLERFKITIKQSVSLPGSVDGLQNRDLGDELRKLKEKDVRIILGNFDEEWALLLFCEAFREKMTGRKYQWILTGVSEDKLWKYYKSKGSECSEQELLIAMDGYIITDITPVTRSQRRTISGMMAHEYSNEYKRRAHDLNIAIDENKFYGYVYDGIWAIALALHKVDYQLKYYNRLVEAGKAKMDPKLDGLTSLLDFDYHRPIWVELIRGALNRTRFHGVTGTVSFHKNERPGLISFSQFQAFRGMSEVIIGSYDALNDHLDLKVGFPISWRGPSPPIDYTIQRVTPFRINRTLFVIISILALFGIVLAFIFLTINIRFRNQRYIKMSSPYLNNLIIIGCILTYTSVIILGLDSGLTSEYNFPYICNARAWVLMAGFTLAFGSMFSKTFRVHSIFTNIKLHKKVIKDYKLFMVVFILLTFDVCILIVWQYFDPFYRETNNGTSIQDSDNEDVIIVPEMEHCQSKRMTIFLSVIYVYKGLLMAFGCFLAWETRHVSIPALNDSKYIGLSVYNVVIMCVIGASLSFVLRDQQDASFVIISIFIIFCSTTTLCLVFVPKIIELKQNPRAGDHRVRATLKTFKKNYREEALGAAASCRDIHGNIIGRGYSVNLNERIKIMLDENLKQRSTLKEKTYELEALTYKYRKIQNMIQSGQYLQALNTTGANSGQIPHSEKVSGSTNTLSPKDRASKLSISFQTQQDKDKLKIMSPAGIATDGFTTLPRTHASSLAHIVTTNTTSTNNTSDLVTDYSSCKMISNTTSSTNLGTVGLGKRALVAFDCSAPVGKNLPDRSNVSLNYTQNLVQASQQVAETSKKASRVGVRNCRYGKRSPKCVTDSSYCSMGLEYELSGTRRSQDDLDLFTVFSYAANSSSSGRSRRARDKLAESNFNRWSEGPFCTLMVRNNDIRSVNTNAPGGAVPKCVASKHQSSAKGEKNADDFGTSCPDITSKSAVRQNPDKPHRVPLRQMSEQDESAKAIKSKVATTSNKAQLSRTLSMIEYLGMDEFDMIARRHDKLVGRKNIKRASPCCYENQTCKCYSANMGGRATPGTRSEHQGRSLAKSERPMTYSSNDPLNSTDLIQTSSRLSCSSCCSLATPTYASQSDVFDETSLSTNSSSSRTPSTSVSESMTQYLSHSHSTTSSNSNIERSDKHPARYCQHHAQASHSMDPHHHHHHHPHHHHHFGGPTSTSSSSTSSIYPDQHIEQPNSGEHSLCTSGVLYCAPSSKEDANNAAQPVSLAPATGEDQASLSTVEVEEPPVGEDELQQKLLIKCDVLENL